MNVLSLFDGISVGQLALSNLGIKIDNYFASEIDKYAIAITKHNFPNTKHIGDIVKWQEWDIDYSSIDLVLGGFPCQPWSMSGKQQGDKDERGMLFWIMLDIMKKVKEHNPDAKFLIENVKMKRDFEEYITKYTTLALGEVEKHLINSSLLTAQSRQRYYWTNIQNITQPEDCGILLKDIIEDGYVDRDKSYCIDASYYKGGNLRQYFEKSRRQLVFTGGAMRGRYLPDGSIEQRIEIRDDEKSNCLTTVQKDTLCIQIGEDDITYRNLTPMECERLQSLPEEFTALGLFETKNGLATKAVSNSQRYKCIGNSWTEKVIRHNFSFLLETSK